MKVIADILNGVPIYSWADNVEPEALRQATNLAQLPMAVHHVALMPDVHPGYGMPIGGVLAAGDVVIPNAVGVDIGCGMRACRTSLEELGTDRLKEIMGGIRQRVPVGFTHHQAAREWKLSPTGPITEQEAEAARTQVGTLGGGNHFIEIQRAEDGRIWVMIHSGSRNVGLKVASHYNKIAVALNEQWRASVPKAWELAFLPRDTEEGKTYLQEMQTCVGFAMTNREYMMVAIQECIEGICPGVTFEDDLDVAHNYVRMEHHLKKNVMVHRKGATAAREGEWGIIPGSQGTASYIVKGLGNEKSFESCSHGAGRRMGRKAAERDLDLAEEVKRLDDLGIVHSVRTKADLDEAAGAYKDIEDVMRQQADLVEVMVKLVPLGVIKG